MTSIRRACRHPRAVPFRRIRAGFPRRLRGVLRGESGMSTAEYAIGTLTAAAFASVLYMLVTSDFVTEALTSLLRQALSGHSR
ncbi:Protein of unknown function [Actinopolyspora mzabensis]|uniref:DUF4244 domain-containing protein n=1 Tax=Actinopolyspora mzabensis TaxID=995066 RepID=A0A1G9AXF6_ACTMZ|nr:DUF4244 domain-containing protein [Actinopolyspora mzabensis]SDK32009.1 Protein of unknown function [Actinopolyspora mzabensis]